MDDCLQCPFSYTKQFNDIANIFCSGNNKWTGLIELKALKEGKGNIQSPNWCPYRTNKKL